MKQSLFTVLENLALTPNVFRLRLRGDMDPPRPGQFVNIQLEGLYLRRPISVCDAEGDVLTLIYKTVGRGTSQLAKTQPGQQLDLLTGLGNGYDLTRSGDHPLLLGGGVGVPPLFLLCRRLRQEGKRVSIVLGFNRAEEVFYVSEFESLGAEVTVTTVDGSAGIRGFVTDALPTSYSHFYACGPLPMLKAVWHAASTDGDFSLEERMGCGFGACMGCSMEIVGGGFKRICRDGPVFRKEELPWNG